MKSCWTFLALLVVLLSACNKVDEAPITDWIQLADFPGTPRATASTFVIGDNAYLCCGRIGYQHDTLNEVWRYESLTDTWTELDTFPGRPRVKAVAVTINGKGYVGMGSNSYIFEESVFRDFYEFDPSTSKWTQKASFPGFASNDLAYTVVNGCLYTAMGFSGTGYSSDTYKYDPVTDVWTKLVDTPKSYNAPAFFSIGNDFYVAGGFLGRNIRTMFRFNTLTGIWTTAASMPEGRVMSNGLEIGGKGYVMLGRYWGGIENGGRIRSDILEYDPTENAWTKRGDFPGGIRQNSMVFTIGGRGYIVMGENYSQRKSDVWSFKP
jgi:N-acetylneuraminic acid mutarotase